VPTTKPGGDLDTEARLEALDGEPCPDSDFTCVTIAVPLDHADPSGDVIEVVFAVLPAAVETKGVFVTATGGPGSSGIAVADSYTSYLDSSITDSFDIVFFDQRGIAMSGGLTCPEAAVTYYRADTSSATGPDIEALAGAAKTFAEACVAEMGGTDLLPYVGTDQAVDDLAAFVEEMGYSRIVLYGESYGTQYAQTFASAHPDLVERVILDGTVDLTLDIFDFLVDQAVAFTRTLQESFDSCGDDEACSEAFGGADPESVYDDLAALLAEGPMEVSYPLPDGSVATRSFTLTDLEIVASGQMYGEEDRMIFLRALAAYNRGDLVPMQRLLYSSLVVDPGDETPIDDPSWSDAMYYGVECLDYGYPGANADEMVSAFEAASGGIESLRLGSIFFGDLPCAYWPARRADTARPAPFVAEGIPVMVLGATSDPATPYEHGVSVYESLSDGHLMTQNGGPHVIFGRGNECPDVDVSAFIVEGTVVDDVTCEGFPVAEFVSLFPGTADQVESAEDFFWAVENETYYLPEFYYWDGYGESAAGCPYGGSILFTGTDVGYEYEFDECGLASDAVIDGTATWDVDADVFAFETVTINGCSTSYRREGEDVATEPRCIPGLRLDHALRL
jgi:pimeloyl-ACP methyl ester carboxylesterase